MQYLSLQIKNRLFTQNTEAGTSIVEHEGRTDIFQMKSHTHGKRNALTTSFSDLSILLPQISEQKRQPKHTNTDKTKGKYL